MHNKDYSTWFVFMLRLHDAKSKLDGYTSWLYAIIRNFNSQISLKLLFSNFSLIFGFLVFTVHAV